MNSIRAIIGAGALLVASGTAGIAADLYGGRGSIKDDYASAPAPVGNRCGAWYARVDGGYSSMDKPSITQAGVDDLLQPNIKDSWTVGGGFGRYLSCNIRADVTYDHRFNSDVTGFNGNVFSPANGNQKFSLSNDVVLFNAYYDFDMRSRFTPYIGVGLGFTHNSVGSGSGLVAATGPNPGSALTIASNSSWHAAAALMTGVSVALRDRLTLDTGYRFLYLGNAKGGDAIDSFGGNAGPNSINELHAHEFRVGLRYELGGGSNCCAAAVPLK